MPGHQDGVAAQEGQAFDSLEHSVDRFEHGSFEERIAGRNSHHTGEDKGHHPHVFRIPAAGRLESRGDSGAFVLLALGECAMAAGMAFEARHMVVQRDPVADFELPGPCARADDSAGGFVAKDARRRDCAILNLLDVGRADAADGHFNQQLIRTDARHRHRLEAQIVCPAINHRAHCPGDVRHGEVFPANADRGGPRWSPWARRAAGTS